MKNSIANPKPPRSVESKAFVYCPICTHTVEGIVVTRGRQSKTKPGQKCSRCAASLDPAYLMGFARAA